MAGLEGLPEGVEMVRIGVAGDEDFELVGAMIFKGIRQGASSGLLVRPAEGYTFQPFQKADIRNLVLVDGPAGSFMAVKTLQEPKTITATIQFAYADESTGDIVAKFLEAAKSIPGFANLKVE